MKSAVENLWRTNLALKIADSLWHDLEGRAGIGNIIDQIDQEVLDEITEDWLQMIKTILLEG